MATPVSIASIPVALAAIIAGVIFDRLSVIGGPECEVNCGPGSLFLPLGLMGFAALAWLAGLVLSVVGLVGSRARAWPGWVGLVASLFIPIVLVVLFATSHVTVVA